MKFVLDIRTKSNIIICNTLKRRVTGVLNSTEKAAHAESGCRFIPVNTGSEWPQYGPLTYVTVQSRWVLYQEGWNRG